MNIMYKTLVCVLSTLALSVIAVTSLSAQLSVTSPTTSFIPALVGNNYDFAGDPQSGGGNGQEADLVGNATHPLMYYAFTTNNTVTAADDSLFFRVRIGNPANTATYGKFLMIGLDVREDNAGDMDIFVGVGNGVLGTYSPGAGLNVSPNTTSIDNPVALTGATASYVYLDATIAPGQSIDVDAANGTDKFLTIRVPIVEINSRLTALGSPNISVTTAMAFVLLTLNQQNSLNGDIGGINGGLSLTTTYKDLGILEPIRLNNAIPVFTSASGTTANVTVVSGTTFVTTATATDADLDVVTFSIQTTSTIGVDFARFTITSSGSLSFIAPPNFASPTDANTDNIYVVTIIADDSYVGGTTTQTIFVQVTPAAVPVVTSLTPSLVSASTATLPLTIRGQFFTNVTSVSVSVLNVSGTTVGSVTLAYTIANDGEITTTLPAGYIITSGSLTLTLTNNIGSSVTTLTITATTPTISSISPTSTSASTNSMALTINGSGFSGSPAPVVTVSVLNTAGVTVGSITLATVVNSNGTITAVIPAGSLVTAGTLSVTVANSAGSATTPLLITSTTPTISSISPSSTSASTNSMALTINGSGFSGSPAPVVTVSVLNTAGVTVGSITLATVVNSNGTITAVIPAGSLVTAGTLSVTVANSAGSATTPLLITSTTPTISSISPTSTSASTNSMALTINGSGFSGSPAPIVTVSVLNTAGVTVGSITLATVVNSNGTITAVIPAGSLVTAGTLSVTVANSAGSVSVPFVVLPGVPSIATISPTTTMASMNSMLVTITGTHLLPLTTLTVTQINSGGAVTGLTNLIPFITSSSATVITVSLPPGSVSTSGVLTLNIANAAGATSAAIIVQSQSIIVTNANNDGGGSLRRAFLLTSSGGTIQIVGEIGEVQLLGGPIMVDKDIRLIGPGSGLQINGNGNTIFYLDCNGNHTLYLENLQLRNSGNGPAIKVDCGNIRTVRVRVTGN